MVSAGNPIYASDYNTLQPDINRWFGDDYPSATPGSETEANLRFGWGQSEISTVSAGNLIYESEFNELINRVNIGIDHTGSAESEMANAAIGFKIFASEYNDIDSKSTAVSAIKNQVDVFRRSISSKDSATYSSTWDNILQYEGFFDFSTYAKARYFFNSGGDIRITPDIYGYSTSVAAAWNTLLSSIGTVIFDLDGAAPTGAVGGNQGVGFYDLTTSYQLIYTLSSSGGIYSGDLVFSIWASRNSSGSQVNLRVHYDNSATSDGLGGRDPVDGNMDTDIDQGKADNITRGSITFSIDNPSYTRTSYTEI